MVSNNVYICCVEYKHIILKRYAVCTLEPQTLVCQFVTIRKKTPTIYKPAYANLMQAYASQNQFLS